MVAAFIGWGAPLTAGAANASASTLPSGFLPQRQTPALPQSALSVPDPAALNASWWDYLAPSQAGLPDRIAALLASAARAADRLPASQAADGAAALERLRIGLKTLPAMLAVRPAAPAAAPAVAANYTTTEFLRFDRHIRDLKTDIDERGHALDILVRALRGSQRDLDASFAAYLAIPGPSPEKTLLGVQVMAQRAQIAATEAEQRIRQAEREALSTEVAALQEIRKLAILRIVPDPERSPQQIQQLIAKTQEKIGSEREEILRLEAQRTAIAGDPGASTAAAELADQKILAAMVEEAYLVGRSALLETDEDWLAVTSRRMNTVTATAIERRIAERTTETRSLETNARDWLAATERALAISLRTPAAGLSQEQMRIREDRIAIAQQTITRIDQLRSLITDVRLETDVTMQLLAEYSGWRGWIWTRILNPAVAVSGRIGDLLGASLFKIGDAPVTTFGLLRIGLILIAALLLSRLIRFLLQRLSMRDRGRSSAGLYAVGRLMHYVLILAALLIGLTSIGLDFSQLALVAGALSIGIGFGLQSVVNNFVSGLMILFERNLKIGDVVKLDTGVTGVVREINVRSTLITTNDNVDIAVPNSEFIAGKVVNYTLRDPFHRIHVPFSAAYGSDKERVRQVITEAARKLPFTLTTEKDRNPDVWLVKLGDNALEFELVVWINPAAVSRPGAVMASYVWEIETTLREHAIEIPSPQRNVLVRFGDGDLPAALRPGTHYPPA